MAEQVVILSYYDEEAKIYNITKKIEVGGHSHKEIRGLLSAFFIRYKCSRSDILQKTVEYVSRNICQQITLTETAKEIGVTGAYLSTVFKKEIGLNFIEYVNIQKIEAAKIMLDKGKFVYEVSGILGFENVTYFSKVFKKYAGISADKWRKRET